MKIKPIVKTVALCQNKQIKHLRSKKNYQITTYYLNYLALYIVLLRYNLFNRSIVISRRNSQTSCSCVGHKNVVKVLLT